MEKAKCILVDDDQWALEDIKHIMRFDEAGFQLIGEYSNAKDALFAIEAHRPQLVISDICLGGMSGLDMIDACRAKGFQAEFILISGYSEFEYARKAISADVCMYLLKPIDAEESQKALRKARAKLEGRQMQMEEEGRHTINQIREYIRQNYQQRLALEDVADRFFINRSYLSELFREKFGKSFVQFKNEVRIEQAKTLLTDTGLSVAEIAGRCGFDNTSYFALVFRQQTGKSPGEFRRR